MTQNKVRLPRAVAEAIEALRAEKHEDDYILWFSCRDDAVESENPYWNILFTFVDRVGNSFLLADALRYGYIVDKPITVTITPERQEEIRAYYAARDYDADNLVHFREGFRSALGLCGIKITGVNDR